jgi:exonuclease VII small subunit
MRRRVSQGLSHVKAGVAAKVHQALIPLRRAIKFFKRKKVNPYEVDENPVTADEGEKPMTFEESLALLKQIVDEMEEEDRLADKFEIKGANEDSKTKRKRKLANLRKRLELKTEIAEEMRKARKEEDERQIREKQIKEAEDAVELAKERFKVVAQLSEAIRLAHRGVQTAAQTVGICSSAFA